MAGRAFGHVAGYGRWGGSPYIGWHHEYNGNISDFNNPSNCGIVVTHSALVDPTGATGWSMEYHRAPTKVSNYAYDLLIDRKRTDVLTLTSRRHQVHQGVVDDVIIKETWEAGNGGAMTIDQLAFLYAVYHTDVDWENGEYLTWRRRSRTPFTYPVEMVNLTIGGESFETALKGQDFRYFASVYCATTEEITRGGVTSTRRLGADGTVSNKLQVVTADVEVWWALRPEDTPDADVFLTAGSTTAETLTFLAD